MVRRMNLLPVFVLSGLVSIGIGVEVGTRILAPARARAAFEATPRGASVMPGVARGALPGANAARLTDLTPRSPPNPASSAVPADIPVPRTSPFLTAQQAEMLATLNAVRAAAGAEPVSEDSRLTSAAASHAAYLNANNVLSHDELPDRPYFTGASIGDRIATQQYPAAVHAVNENYVVRIDSPQGCLDWLASTVYHLGVVVASEWRDVGVAFQGRVCVIAYARARDSQLRLPPEGSYIVYPGNGRAGVATAFRPGSEIPDPAPDLDMAGQPVLISLTNRAQPLVRAENIVVDSFTLVPTDGDRSVPVAARVIAAPRVRGGNAVALSADPLVRAEQIFLLPIAPLQPGISYTASFSGRVDGRPVLRTWKFRTAG
jgi:uncharacterized protein YkwD